jgi:hypothetical protein
MCARRIRREPRPDSWILDDGPDIELLRAIAAGRVVRADEDGQPGSTAIMAGHFLDGVSVRMNVLFLSDDELVEMPISGPPRLAPRGNRLLAMANGEIAVTGYE